MGGRAHGIEHAIGARAVTAATDRNAPFPPPSPDSPAGAESPTEVLYHSDRSRVVRRRLPDAGSVVDKRLIGPDALRRARHETTTLRRLAGVPGVVQLAGAATVPVDPADQVLDDTILLIDDGGSPLTAVLAAGRLEPPAVLSLAWRLATVVAAVHARGVVHQDLNPANILLVGPDQAPVLIDFGLATTFAEERPGFLHPTEIAGTLAYLAPEQTGRTGRPVDERADLYALGATLYELLTGRPPFTATDPLKLIHDQLARAPVPPAELDQRVPAGLSAIVLRLLEKEPDRRYQSAQGLAYDLARLTEVGDGPGAVGFALGERDFPLRLAPSSRLVGRDPELAALAVAVEAAVAGSARGLLVAGAPGVGKTSLINELRPLVTGRHGWFVTGKFDQYRAGTAGSAVLGALGGLGRLLLAEPEAELAAARQAIRQALGPNAGLIADVLPEFGLLLGAGDTTPGSTDPAEAETRLRLALVDLLRAVASPAQPVVLVLDDLQWADQDGLGFLDAVLTDPELAGVLLVGAYRDGEVDAAHPLSAMLERWQHLGVAPTLLRLANLPPTDVAVLLRDMLRLPSAAAAEQLSAELSARTAGNPYDTVELVSALRWDGVLVPGETGWSWDAAAIRGYVGHGDVVDLLAVRVARLPEPVRDLLATMACLGGQVRPPLLAAASGLTVPATEELLAPALEDGLLVLDRDADLVRFRHDRVHQAVYGGLRPDRRQARQLTLARRLAVLPDWTVEAAGQYLPAVAAVRDAAERCRVVELFQAAAAGARRTTSYAAMERYLTAALGLLDGGADGTDDRLLTSLRIERHAALYSLGRLAEADEAYRLIAAGRIDPVELAEPTCVQVNSLGHRGRLHDALALGAELLGRLDLPVPADPAAELPGLLAGLRSWMEATEGAADADRPEPADPRVLAAARLIYTMTSAALMVDPALLGWLVFQAQRLWVAYGPCPALALALSMAPSVVVGLSADYRIAYAVCQRVITVAEARGYQKEMGNARLAAASFALHWFEPAEVVVEQARLARVALLHAGDAHLACYTYNCALSPLVDTAPTVDGWRAEAEAALGLAKRTGLVFAVPYYLTYGQLAQALCGLTAAPGSFTDETYDEEAAFAAMARDPHARALAHTYRALAAAVFGDGPALARHAAAARQALDGTAWYEHAVARALSGLALAEQARASAPADRGAVLAELDECRDWLAARAADAPANFGHLLALIEAERAWATGDGTAALAGFDAALRAVDGRPRAWRRALLTERAAACYEAYGQPRASRLLLAQARQLYLDWGATGKVRAMDAAHPDLPGPTGQTGAAGAGDAAGRVHSASTTMLIDTIDLMAVLRASQALSSETNLDRLRARVADQLGAMTGATSVRLLIRDGDTDGWLLPPEWTTGPAAEPTAEPAAEPAAGADDRPAVLDLAAAAAAGMLPLSAVQYALRTREPLLVRDAAGDERFTRDAYLAGLDHGSLLVLPILSQGQPRAVLLLENRLSRDAFSADRLGAVTLVAGQLAVSLDNAMLYASLEAKVAERTQALELANQQLTELSSTDPLTGLANRRRLTEMLAAEWLRALRGQYPLAVAMVDVDHFKKYNDRYGHVAGDACLRQVAGALQRSVRAGSDLVARYGGEEFALLLPGADLTAALRAAERARAAVVALAESNADADGGTLTVSIGVATVVPADEKPDAAGVEDLVMVADAALYRAKLAGRNQVAGPPATNAESSTP
jgi:diguanylate cyclase (GGDEF)-like protein